MTRRDALTALAAVLLPIPHHDGPQWTPAQKQWFREQWQAHFAGSGMLSVNEARKLFDLRDLET